MILLLSLGIDGGALKLDVCKKSSHGRTFCPLLVEPLFRVRDLSRDLEKTERTV
jgi:hypothetical protein